MELQTVQKYAVNCFLLTLPILVWNVVLSHKLPNVFQSESFWNAIPAFLAYGENSSRVVIFLLIGLMPLRIVTITQKRGLFVYLSGVIVYFASWLALIYLPDSTWSNTIAGFLAPSYTPLVWLAGIGLIADSFYFNIPYSRWYFILASIVFLVFHNLHVYLVFCRTH